MVPGKVNPVLKEVAGTVNRYDIIDCQSLVIVGENKVDLRWGQGCHCESKEGRY